MAAIVEGPLIAALSCGKPVYLVVLLNGHDSDSRTLINHALNWAMAYLQAGNGSTWRTLAPPK